MRLKINGQVKMLQLPKALFSFTVYLYILSYRINSLKFFYKALLTFATDSAKCKYTEHYYYSFTPLAKTTTVSGTNEVSSTYKSEAVTQLKQLQLDHNTQLTATANKPYQRQRETVKQQTDKQSNTDRIDKLEKALVEIQMNNESTQQQLSDVQKVNSHLQNQLSINQQQLSDVQRKNDYLQNQLSLTQQQLLGVQSMMTCSRLWVVSHDQFTIGREIGRGAWATVHETTFRGATIAAKRLHQLITVSQDQTTVFKRDGNGSSLSTSEYCHLSGSNTGRTSSNVDGIDEH